MLNNNLALGTVQFGLDYGIANNSGRVTQSQAAQIISLAKSVGIDTIDTAIAYGSSEQVLGSIGVGDFNVVTKLPSMPQVDDVEAWVSQELKASRDRLNVSSLYAVLLHRPQDLFGESGVALAVALQDLKSNGVVQKVGISIYEPNELDGFISMMPIDLVQAPLNIIDRRLETSGWLKRLKDSGMELHIRSVFLQGLLLIPPQEIPQKFDRWRASWDRWQSLLKGAETSALAACLAYPLSS
jgi:aryl-alcohol dehydrogenase-like predicted oxidoreductase